MAKEAVAMAKQQGKQRREVAVADRITLHTTRYISVYVGWSTFDAVDFWCLLLHTYQHSAVHVCT